MATTLQQENSLPSIFASLQNKIDTTQNTFVSSSTTIWIWMILAVLAGIAATIVFWLVGFGYFGSYPFLANFYGFLHDLWGMGTNTMFFPLVYAGEAIAIYLMGGTVALLSIILPLALGGLIIALPSIPVINRIIHNNSQIQLTALVDQNIITQNERNSLIQDATTLITEAKNSGVIDEATYNEYIATINSPDLTLEQLESTVKKIEAPFREFFAEMQNDRELLSKFQGRQEALQSEDPNVRWGIWSNLIKFKKELEQKKMPEFTTYIPSEHSTTNSSYTKLEKAEATSANAIELSSYPTDEKKNSQ